MARRFQAYERTGTEDADSAFTVSFTSLSLILLAFFIFLDAVAVPDNLRESDLLDSITEQFVKETKKEHREDGIEETAREAQFEVVREKDHLRITMPGAALFASGDDQIKPNQLAILGELADKIADLDLAVSIEGHTDSRPIRTARFPSNWELSAARAVSVLRFFLARGIPEHRLSAAGRAEFQPTDSNETEEGRARNRRVVLLLSGKKGAL